MSIKLIITGGCSFSDAYNQNCWPYILRQKFVNINFIDTGYSAQGQEMIQKKCSKALIESLKTYDANEILVLAMWSGTNRKSFFVNDTYFIENLVYNWTTNSKANIGMPMQLIDLNNQIADEHQGKFGTGPEGETIYSKKGGWYTFNPSHCSEDSILVKEYGKSYSDNLPGTIISLENIIALQNLCELKKVKFYQSFFMSEPFEDIEKFKNNDSVKYLYEQLNHDIIISKQGIFDYLKKFQHEKKYFEIDNCHPNVEGHTKWVNEVLLPKLSEMCIINEN